MNSIRIFAFQLIGLSLVALTATAQTKDLLRDAIEQYETGKAPGLQVTIVLRQADGAFTPVDPQREFRQGERVKIKLESNFQGYLYIVNHGASGRKNLLFPSGKESNRIEPRKTYLLPRAYALVFDGTAGFETLQVIASPQPLPLIEAASKQPEGELNAAQSEAVSRFWRDASPVQAGISSNSAEEEDGSRDPAFDKRRRVTTVISSNRRRPKSPGGQSYSDEPASLGIKLKNLGAGQ